MQDGIFLHCDWLEETVSISLSFPEIFSAKMENKIYKNQRQKHGPPFFTVLDIYTKIKETK